MAKAPPVVNTQGQVTGTVAWLLLFFACGACPTIRRTTMKTTLLLAFIASTTLAASAFAQSGNSATASGKTRV